VLLDRAKTEFGVATPFGGPTSSGMLTLHCPPDAIHRLATFLREHGAESVIVADIETASPSVFGCAYRTTALGRIGNGAATRG